MTRHRRTGASGASIGPPLDGCRLNNDPAARIDPAQNADASDVAGGSLTAGARLPWAALEQRTGISQQISVPAFKRLPCVTQGQTLNISPAAEAEAPSIDFAGADRTVPRTTWYEPNAALGGKLQVLGSRVDGTGGQWIPQGQNRSAALPSLNIHTGSDAENPAVTSGATLASNAPMPWVACHEQDDAVSSPQDQIFVSNGVQQTTAQHPCHRARR